jgi:hypothetical protein
LKLLSKRLADPHTVSLARLPAISTDECTVLQHGAPFRLREPVLFCVFLRHPEVLSVHQTHIESAQSDKARFARVDDGALIPWIDEEVRSLWGVKAAVRVLGIATKGWDVKPVGAIANRRPSEIRTNRVSQVPVPGIDPPVGNLFGVSQVLTWIAGQRGEISEDLQWRSQVDDLMAKLDV